jgi:predicted ATP-dependent endonuclease of OLD family
LSEKLIIRNFGPIKEVELDLKKFNVIIGEQATGKSTIVKILSMCRYFSYIVKSNFSKYSIILGDKDGTSFYLGLDSWGLNEFYKDGSHIYYKNADYEFKIDFYVETSLPNFDTNGNQTINKKVSTIATIIPISKVFESLLKELNYIKPQNDLQLQNWHIPTSFFLNDVSNVMSNPFYLPTERGLQSIFSLGKNSIQNISDTLFNQLAKLDFVASKFEEETEIEPLNISYKNVDGRGFIKKNGEELYYSLNNGASGYKSAIPIILVMKYYNDVIFKDKSFIIEEPELNLYPNAQMELMKFLVANSYQNVNTKKQILLTTHSPYILTSLNNLLYAYEVGKNNRKMVIENLKIGSEYWLNPSTTSAYKLVNGVSVDIMDEELKQIKVEEIDEISEVLSNQWHEMAELNLVKH